ncbi:unnamed protein product, partial [Vitis vinifera]|uniref:Uncharacterized protein n=1 Tax=Vitis vinifera TaxID=29760 RepID=D7SYF2_VITVI
MLMSCICWTVMFQKQREGMLFHHKHNTIYIGRSCFCRGWVECTIRKGFSCTCKTDRELALVSWLSSVWTILQYFPDESNAPGCCLGNSNDVLFLILHKNIKNDNQVSLTLWSGHLIMLYNKLILGKKNKSSTELWLEKFYKKKTNLPEPLPHELVERLEKFLDNLEEELVDLSYLLYDHRLQDAHLNSS